MKKLLSLVVFILLQSTYSFCQCTANFSVTNTFGCAPLNTVFTDASSSAIQWLWNFGDGSTSSAQNPTHSYNTPGNYSVSLTITASNGCTVTKTKTNLVSVIGPNIKFSTSDPTGSSPLTVFFDNETSYSAPPVSFLWSFGDGSTSSAENPIHTYLADGIYTLSLKVRDLDGCDRTLTKTNLVQISETPLPITLISYSAKVKPNHIVLLWKTSAEIDNKTFIIKRSTDGITFNTIASINGQNNTSGISNYSYIDNSPFNGNNYYQLLQEDNSGKQKTLGVIRSNFNLKQDDLARAYPNPTSDVFTVDIKPLEFNKATLVNVDGKVLEIKQISKQAKKLSFSLRQQKPGMYFVKLRGLQTRDVKIIRK